MAAEEKGGEAPRQQYARKFGMRPSLETMGDLRQLTIRRKDSIMGYGSLMLILA